MVSDDDLSRLIEDFIQAAVLSKKAGFQFVDIKQCHGYLGHELLSAVDRPGKFGGSFIPETLKKPVEELTDLFKKLRYNKKFIKQRDYYFKNYHIGYT